MGLPSVHARPVVAQHVALTLPPVQLAPAAPIQDLVKSEIAKQRADLESQLRTLEGRLDDQVADSAMAAP